MRRATKKAPEPKERYHHGDLAKALVREATRVVEAHGHAAVSVREVARAVGVSAAAPFRHFADRDDLLRAVALAATERFAAMAAKALEEAGDDPLLQFRALGLTHVRFTIRHPNLARLMQLPEMRTPPRGASAEQRRLLESVHARTRGLVEAAQRRGSVRSGDPAIYELAGVALAHGLAQLILEGQIPAKGADELVETVLDVLGSGLAPAK